MKDRALLSVGLLITILSDFCGNALDLQTVEVGETVIIPCPLSTPGGSVRWLQNGIAVVLDPSAPRRRQWTVRADGSAALTIVSARSSDAGHWKCQELEGNGNVKNVADVMELVVGSPSPPTGSPSDPFLEVEGRRLLHQATLTVREPQGLYLHCVVTGAVPPVRRIHWAIGDANLTSSAELFVEFSAETDAYTSRSVLSLNASRSLHGKDLVCMVHHLTWLQAAAVSVSLNVLYDPSFSISRNPGFGFPLSAGLRVWLRCEVDANPPSRPVWVRDDGPIDVPQDEAGFLNFSSISGGHSGWYRCTTEHEFGFFASFGYFLNVRTVDLPVSTVKSSGQPGEVRKECELDGRPEVTAVNKSLMALAGKSALLTGQLCSDSPPTRVLWILRQNLVLRPGEGKYPFIAYNLTPTEVPDCWLAGLELRLVGLEDSGEILLLARNAQGFGDASFFLNVTRASSLSSVASATGPDVVSFLLPLCLLWLMHRNGS